MPSPFALTVPSLTTLEWAANLMAPTARKDFDQRNCHREHEIGYCWSPPGNTTYDATSDLLDHYRVCLDKTEAVRDPWTAFLGFRENSRDAGEKKHRFHCVLEHSRALHP